MPDDTPWAGLETGKIDTRRVDARARWNWFWAVMPRAEATLVLRLQALPTTLPALPKLKAIEIGFQTLNDGPAVYVRLKDASHIELFETLCRDMIAAGEQAETEPEALIRMIARTFRWHHLLRTGSSAILSEDEQKGLIGEIAILKLLMPLMGAGNAIACWTGPSGAPKDFELPSDCIEVKARRGASQPFVSISNEFQLSDVPGRQLWLCILDVDRVQAPVGRTLHLHVDDVTAIIAANEPAAITDWEQHLANCGYDPSHDYSLWTWRVSTPNFHEVRHGFPRIVTPMAPGVSAVSYKIAIAACEPFRAGWDEIQSKIERSCRR